MSWLLAFFISSLSLALAIDTSPTPSSTPEPLYLHCGEKDELETTFKICVYTQASNKITAVEDVAQGFAILKKIDSWINDLKPDTQINQINAVSGAQAVRVSNDLFKMLEYALEVSRLTQGAFDPSFNILGGLYNFQAGEEREPRESEIKERLPLINYKNIIIDRTTQTVFLKRPGMRIGLGAMGQGYGVDEVVAFLKSRGYSAGYVDGSGDTRFWGKKPDGSLWVVGVRNPRDKSKNICKLYGTDFAITTTGDDEKFFMIGPRRVHHILDPKTGKPSQASQQVTVLAQTTVTADAFDTAAFVLGPRKGKTVLEKNKLAGILIDGKTGQVTFTRNLKKKKTEFGEVYVVVGQLGGKNVARETEGHGPPELAPALRRPTPGTEQVELSPQPPPPPPAVPPTESGS